MLKTALKHFIYDICIDVAFRNVIKNFKSKDSSILKVGDFFRMVSHIYADECYYNCIINSVEERINANGEKYDLIFITYDSYGGEDLAEMQEDIDDFDDDDVIIINGTDTISELFDEGDIEFIEYDGSVALNTLYYNFYR
jgi:hypothetical protein